MGNCQALEYGTSRRLTLESMEALINLGVNLDWLVTGRGEMFAQPPDQPESPSPPDHAPKPDPDRDPVRKTLDEFDIWACKKGRTSPNFPGWLGYELEKVIRRGDED